MSETPANEVVIREAIPTDCNAIMALIRTYYKEQALNFPPINDYDCMQWILETVRQKGSMVAVCDGRVVGSVGLAIYRFNHNRGVCYLHNEWFTVHPLYRKLGIAFSLIEKCKRFADIMSDGAKINIPLMFTVSSGISKEIDNLVKLCGLSYAGGTLTYRMDMEASKGETS